MTEHINSAFDAGLKEVNKQIAKLGALAETQLDDSLTALKEKNIQKFESIINRDKSLDKITADVSSSVFELLALWSPIAYDLRSLLVADRVGAILERIGDYSKNISQAVKGADVVVIGTPLSVSEKILPNIAESVSPKTIITDVGSVKGGIVNAARESLANKFCNFVPGHPIAGTEKNGVEYSFEDLFVNHRVILMARVPVMHEPFPVQGLR